MEIKSDMSQLFSSNDPWENGWNEDDKYETNFGGVISDIDYPASYSQIAKNIGNISIEDLLSRVDISPYQKQNLLLTFFNQSLSLQKDTYKILGLIALELDTPGLGDIVTFNYRQGTLPKFDDDTIQGILHKKQRKLSEDFRDPLGVVTKPDVTSPVKELQSTWEARPPVIEDSQEQDLTPPAVLAGETSSILAENIAEINKYMNSVRDQFNPIIGSENIIKIKEVPEKEGLLFKHVNYLITNENNRGKKVIRRYSDFVWYV